jgi:hypothetical protein
MKPIIAVALGFAALGFSTVSAQAQIKIPNPPRSGQAVYTYSQCLKDAHRIRDQRIRQGHDSRATNLRWKKQVANCGKLPDAPKPEKQPKR